jgi:pimeloyl-ACP methyl ester carboxylesterase
LISAFAAYGRETKTPSLWVYGDNDSYWKPWLSREMHQRYVQAGGPARLVAFGKFEDDSHNLFGARLGVPVWLPEVEKFLDELKLPTRKLHKIPLVAHDDPESVVDTVDSKTALKK